MAKLNRDILSIDIGQYGESVGTDGYDTPGANIYAVKYDKKIQRLFKRFTPKVYSGGLISTAIFTGLGIAGIIAGPIAGLTVGAVAAVSAGIGAVAQATYSATLYGTELSSASFNKRGFGGTEDSAYALIKMKEYQKKLDSSRKRVITLETGEKITRQELKKRIKELDSRVGSIDIVRDSAETAHSAAKLLENNPNTNAFTIDGVNYSRKSLQSLLDENENIAYHGLKYLLGQGLIISDKLNGLSSKPKSKEEQSQLTRYKGIMNRIADCTEELATQCNREYSVTKKNSKVRGMYNPYKNLIAESIRKGCLLGDDSQNNTIRKLAKEKSKDSAFAQYSIMYEQQVLEKISEERDSEIAEKEKVVKGVKRVKDTITTLNEKDGKVSELTKEQRRLNEEIQIELSYEALIVLATETKKYVFDENDRKDIESAIRTFRDARKTDDKEVIEEAKNQLDNLIKEIIPKINLKKYVKQGKEAEREEHANATKDFVANLRKYYGVHKDDTDRRVAEPQTKNQEIEKLKRYIDNLERYSDDLRKRFNGAKRSAREKKRKVEELENQRTGLQIERRHLTTQVDDLTTQLRDKDTLISEQTEENARLQRRAEHLDRWASAGLGAVGDSEEALQIAGEEITTLKRKAKGKDAKHKKAIEERDSLIARQVEENNRLKSAEADAKQQLADAEQQNRQLKTDLGQARQTGMEIQGKLGRVIEIARKKSKENRKLREEKRQQSKENARLQRERDHLDAWAAAGLDQVDQLGSQITEKDESLKRQIDRNAGLTSENAGLRTRVAETDKALEQARGANEALSRKNAGLKSAVAESKKVIGERDVLIARQTEENVRLQRERDYLDAWASAGVDQFEKGAKLTSENAGLRTRAAETDEELKKARGKNEALSRKAKEKDAKHKKAIEEKDATIRKQDATIAEQREENFSLSDRLEDALRANGDNLWYIADLKAKNKDLRKSVIDVGYAYDEVSRESARQAAEIGDLQRKNTQLERENDEMADRLSYIDSKNETQIHNRDVGAATSRLDRLIEKVEAHIEYTMQNETSYDMTSIKLLMSYMATFKKRAYQTVDDANKDKEFLIELYELKKSTLSKLSAKKLKEVVEDYRQRNGFKR